MPDQSLATVFHCATELITVLSKHYHALVFSPNVDIYHTNHIIDRMRRLLAEASAEMDNRQAFLKESQTY